MLQTSGLSMFSDACSDRRHLYGLWLQQAPWTRSWRLAAAELTDIRMAAGGSINHEQLPGLGGHMGLGLRRTTGPNTPLSSGPLPLLTQLPLLASLGTRCSLTVRTHIFRQDAHTQ